MREYGDILVTNISSFSHNVFCRFRNKFQLLIRFILSSVNAFSFDQFEIVTYGFIEFDALLARLLFIQYFQRQISVNPFLKKPRCLLVRSTSVFKTPWEKEKLLVTCFLLIWRTFCHLYQI